VKLFNPLFLYNLIAIFYYFAHNIVNSLLDYKAKCPIEKKNFILGRVREEDNLFAPSAEVRMFIRLKLRSLLFLIGSLPGRVLMKDVECTGNNSHLQAGVLVEVIVK
jgi:hypothetical protein